MSLKDSLSDSPNKKKRGMLCSVARIRNGLDGDELVALDDAIQKIRNQRDAGLVNGQSGYNCIWLHKVLLSEGYEVSALTIQKHISFRCACGF